MRSTTATEMALAIRVVGVDEASALETNVFGVERVVFPVAKMSVERRRGLRKRLASELDDLRDALRKVELYSCVPGAAGEDGGVFTLEAAVDDDEDGGRAAKRRNVSPSAERARERLTGRLASMAAALPDHVVAFLQDRHVGDADSRGDDGEIEMGDAESVKGGALFQLKMLLDKFAPEVSTPKMLVDKFAAALVSTPKSRGGRSAPLAASGVSCLSQAQHQEAGGRMPPVQEEEEEEAINICGGVSRIAIRDIAEEYGELVNDIGVPLLSPLQHNYVALAEEEDRYVDICGDASPVVFSPKNGDRCSPSLSTSSDSDATSTDSDSSSSSPEALRKENSHCIAGEPVPAPEADPVQGVHNRQPPRSAPEAIHIAEPENQGAVATVLAVTKSPPAQTVLPKECGALAQPPRPASEAIHIAEPENQCAAATVIAVTKSPPAPTSLPKECAAATVIAVTSPPAPTSLPKECGALAQPPEQAPEAVQIAEQEEPKCVAPAALVHPITGSALPAAVLPNENGTSSQPAPVPAPVAPQTQPPPPPPPQPQPPLQPQPQPQSQPPPPPPPQPQPRAQEVETSDLIAMAHEEKKRRAMAKARQKLLEMEKAALPDQRIHPRDMELLGISAFEHVVSTVRDASTAPPEVNDEADLSFLPDCPSILQQLGVYLKADDGCEEEQSPPLAVASDGEEMDMEIEEGQIV